MAEIELVPTCTECGQPVMKEMAVALKGGFRHYICPPPKVEFHPGKGKDRYYLIDGERELKGVPIVSVTRILKEIGDKFGQAAWWGMKVGVKGYHSLIQAYPHVINEVRGDELGSDKIIDTLKREKLTVNHTRDQAASRGTSVHGHAEDWANTGHYHDPAKMPDSEQPYHEAFVRFITENTVIPINAEVIVGSRKHAYAGTFDLYADCELTDWRGRPLRGLGVLDYKTKFSPPKGKKRDAYEQHHLQLRAYEDARIEMGGTHSDFQAVVNLYPDGSFAVVESRATSAQWRDCLAAYRSLSSLRDSLKAAA